MAFNYQGLSDLLEKQGYYGAGGGRPDAATQIGQILGGVGQAIQAPISAYNQAINTGIQRLKAQRALTPSSQLPEESLTLPELKEKREGERAGAEAKFYGGKEQRAEKTIFVDNVTGDISPTKTPTSIELPESIGTTLSEKIKGQVSKDYQSANKTGWKLSSFTDAQGRPLLINPQTGETKPAGEISASSPFAQARVGQFASQELPSQSGMNTAAGQAYQIKSYARRGKSLVAKATTPQAMSLASIDLARIAQGGSPQLAELQGADFAQNWLTQFNALKQRATADTTGADTPKIRKEMFNLFQELEDVGTPFIKNQLDTMERQGRNVYFKDWEGQKKAELGENLPPIQFNEIPVKGQRQNKAQTIQQPQSQSALTTTQTTKYNNIGEVKRDVATGILTKQKAVEILKSQFGME